MSFEITGKLIAVSDTQQVSDRFKKREFVLETAEEINGNVYTNYAKMQLVQNKCEIIDNFNVGEDLKVSFNVKGNKWERDGKVNYITNLDAWRIERAEQGGGMAAPASPAYTNMNAGGSAPQQGPDASGYNPSPESADDLPF
ncbi:MAG: DUF3127 domain-containing protein [Chitinophagales bacterium]|nr:DUF3127 domain-containing protein [Chitinophagaceae bacterium]MCB9064173.1 DUF3127 domain-containing protein [Chitinophagales bacterium]